jgi:hypothetical protein
LTYSWLYNGAPVSSPAFTVSSSGNTSGAVFAPTSSYVGNGQTIGVNIYDGYDSVSCSWSTNVVNTCSIASPFPASTTYKIANAGATNLSFGGVPSDSTCAASWTLNGSAFATGPLLNMHSSDFTGSPTVNNLTLTLNNGVSNPTTRTWFVTKNQVPTCSAQTPGAAPASMIYSSTPASSSISSTPTGRTAIYSPGTMARVLATNTSQV